MTATRKNALTELSAASGFGVCTVAPKRSKSWESRRRRAGGKSEGLSSFTAGGVMGSLK